jgi:hypothetical protein
MRWEEMAPSETVENADWIGARLHPFNAYDVGAVIPTGFAAYAKVLHPASTWRDHTDVRWAEVAASTGKVIHPLVQFHAIATPVAGRELEDRTWSGEPRIGTLSDRQAHAMARLVEKHTSTPDACWFCLWDGYGYFAPGGMIEARAYFTKGSKPRLSRLPFSVQKKPKKLSVTAKKVTPNNARSYLLFTGSVRDAVGWEDGPNIWWPHDRAWCVASEIDLPYSYVGGSKELIEEVLADSELEALPAQLEDPVTYDSDTINEP